MHLPVSSTAGSIPRINSTSEVRHSAQASSDVEGELQTLESCLCCSANERMPFQTPALSRS